MNKNPINRLIINFLIVSLAEGCFLASFSQNHPEVTIPGTEERILASSILGQDIVLDIKLPESYYSDNQKQYPVFYVTDANRSFPMIANIAFVLGVPAGVYEDFILVGIGYRKGNFAEWTAWRTRDLTPVNAPETDKYWSDLLTQALGKTMEVKTGGAGRFLDCIIHEIIPFVETNYRASPANRSLGGYSYGGLFSLYALFKHPEVFRSYFAGSPSISFGKAVLFEMEEESAKGRADVPVQLLMTAGSLEPEPMTGNVKKMAEQLQSRNYPGLTVKYRIFDNEDHRSCYPSAFMWGIRELFQVQMNNP